jgi:hypothetical protein
VIGAYGLEDCVDLVAQATPAQLSQIFDLDLWRPVAPGLDEQFDASRFGLWIEVLVEAGAEVAAAKLAEMPLPQIVAGLAQHVKVFDVSAVSSYETTDGMRIDYSRPVRDLVGCEIGGYHVAAMREESWDAIVEVLAALDMNHPDRFVALMRAVRSRSHSVREEDGFHRLLGNRAQMMFELADDRERRRVERGFASPAEARAFLQTSRSVTADTIAPNPIARDHLRSMETGGGGDDTPTATPEAEAEAVELLAEAGVMPISSPRALLAGETEKTTRLQRCMQFAFDRDQAAYGERQVELAFLANVLMSGCPIQARPFTPAEAADAVVAICGLGLERVTDPPDGYLVAHDLIGVFQLGWTALHQEVCVLAAEALADVLRGVRVADHELQASLNLLRVRLLRALDAGTPWTAAPALDVLTGIDLPAWAALVALIAECPVIHAGLVASVDRRVLSVDPSAFEFISTLDQLALVQRFLHSLPGILSA